MIILHTYYNNLIRILLPLLLIFFIISCGEKEEEKPRVAVVVSTLNNPWFVVLAQSAAQEVESLGYEAKIFDSQNNTALETDHFENLIASNYSAVLFNPTDADGSIANVLQAKAAGIPVFCMDREVNDAEAPTCQILSDSYSGCVSLGTYFVQEMNKTGKYAELLGLVGDNNTWSRSRGFHSVVDDYPELEMAAQQSADFDRNKAMEVMESILQAHPDIDGVFCGNDAMALGAYQALLASGLDDSVKVFGFDGADEVVQMIGEGKIEATGMQFPVVMAQTAARFADQYFNGKRDFPKKIPVAVEMVKSSNVSYYLNLNG